MIKRICTSLLTFLIITVVAPLNAFATEQATTIEATGRTLILGEGSSNVDMGIVLWTLCFIAVVIVVLYMGINTLVVKKEEGKRIAKEISKPKLIITHGTLSSNKNR